MNTIKVVSIILTLLAFVPLLLVIIKVKMLKAFKQKATNTTATITTLKNAGAQKEVHITNLLCSIALLIWPAHLPNTALPQKNMKPAKAYHLCICRITRKNSV